MIQPPTLFEIACGVLVEPDPPPAATPRVVERTARTALEAALCEVLQTGPCFVAFSGGRDSSALLAVAAHVATREGLPPPVPVTQRYPGHERAEESEWQERVVRHLALRDWLRTEVVGDELDLVGTTSSYYLREHGLLWPGLGYMMEPSARLASGGSLVTGLDGDTVFGGWFWQAIRSPRDEVSARGRAARLGMALAPAPAAARFLRSRSGGQFPWLLPAARAQALRATTSRAVRTPRSWPAWLSAWLASRQVRLLVSSIAATGERTGTRMVHPFLDARFLDALGRDLGVLGPRSRTAGMQRLFADLLPGDVLRRTSKAEFSSAVWTEPARAFVAHGAAELAPAHLVDRGALHAEWRKERPHGATVALLQWCRLQADRPQPTS